jgi:hypothetical protein
MKPQKAIIIALGVIISVSIIGLVIWLRPQTEQAVDQPQVTQGPSQDLQASVCGIESCHGLDISCGANVPDVCTQVYMPGDACRKYVECTIIDGVCTRPESPQFDACKSCVEECERNFQDDPSEFFECESSCV